MVSMGEKAYKSTTVAAWLACMRDVHMPAALRPPQHASYRYFEINIYMMHRFTWNPASPWSPANQMNR